MKYIQCPDIFVPSSINDYQDTVFLGGGISGCPPWQDEAVNLFKDSGLTIINPRRKDFDTNNKSMFYEQIEWEYWHLKLSAIKLFWFPKDTLCPITLFELGKHLKDKNVFVGCDPLYQRAKDIFYQMQLDRNEGPVRISYSVEHLVNRVIEERI